MAGQLRVRLVLTILAEFAGFWLRFHGYELECGGYPSSRPRSREVGLERELECLK